MKNLNISFQSLYVEKAMAASGASPEDIAKTLLIQVSKCKDRGKDKCKDTTYTGEQIKSQMQRQL